MLTPLLAPVFSSIFALALVFGVLSSGVQGDERASMDLKLTTERVIVFKDGYCLIVKEGIATTDADGFVFTKQVPDAAILGSFWAIPEKGNIKSMVAGWVEEETETTRQVNCKNTIEVVAANLGKHCSFTIGDDSFSGVLKKILSNDQLDAADARTLRVNQRLMSSASSFVPPPATVLVSRSVTTGSFFVLSTDHGDMMVAANSVSNLTIVDMNSTLKQTVTKKSRHKRIAIDFGTPNTPIKISWMYFRPDVRWIPTYRVNLTDNPYESDGKKQDGAPKSQARIAELAMQGEILNEAEDLIDVPFHVVVGVPNFRFRSVPSPMTLESTMRNLLAQSAPNLMGNPQNNFLSNAIYTQRSSEFQSNRAAGNTARATVDLPSELTGSGGNDLFVYELPKMTLKKGERATVPILKTEIPYRDVFTWNIEVAHSETYAASTSGTTSPLVLSENKVWRNIELINNTDLPWTTGAAMFVDGFQPLAQDLLTYTSPGGICRVPVTISVDLRGKVEDREVGRKLKALRWRNSDYAQVKGKMAIELANNKAEPVVVEVHVRFGGKATDTSDDGKVTLESYRQTDWKNNQGDRINNSSSVRWDATIEPGECFYPSVDYEFWLRY